MSRKASTKKQTSAPAMNGRIENAKYAQALVEILNHPASYAAPFWACDRIDQTNLYAVINAVRELAATVAGDNGLKIVERGVAGKGGRLTLEVAQVRGFTCYNCTTEFATAKEAAEHVLNAPACFDAQDLEDIASAGFANFYVGVRVSGHAARAVAKKIRGSTQMAAVVLSVTKSKKTPWRSIVSVYHDQYPDRPNPNQSDLLEFREYLRARGWQLRTLAPRRPGAPTRWQTRYVAVAHAVDAVGVPEGVAQTARCKAERYGKAGWEGCSQDDAPAHAHVFVPMASLDPTGAAIRAIRGVAQTAKTVIADTVREILKKDTTHVPGTKQSRIVDDAVWRRNLDALRAYIRRLPNRHQKILAFREGQRVAKDVLVRPRRVPSESYERRRLRAVAAFAGGVEGRET